MRYCRQLANGWLPTIVAAARSVRALQESRRDSRGGDFRGCEDQL